MATRWLTATVFLLAIANVSFAADAVKPILFGTLKSDVPADWKTEKPANRLRSHQFKIASGEEGLADAEVIVMPESSPKPDKEFPRWKTQFVLADGVKIDDVAKETKFEVSGATIHLLDISGTWKYKERPFDLKSKEETKPEYRVVWGIVVVKDEATHVRLSGPDKVVAKQFPAFEKWLKSIK